MKELLGKRWFLLMLLAGLALGWLRPQWLRPATAWLEPRVIVAVALFVMAWSLESRSLFQALLRPWPALWAWSISYSALPALAWLVGWLLPQDDLRLGFGPRPRLVQPAGLFPSGLKALGLLLLAESQEIDDSVEHRLGGCFLEKGHGGSPLNAPQLVDALLGLQNGDAAAGFFASILFHILGLD